MVLVPYPSLTALGSCKKYFYGAKEPVAWRSAQVAQSRAGVANAGKVKDGTHGGDRFRVDFGGAKVWLKIVECKWY